ncbi:unnamed protein product [Rangifer tarandus platyrhynchus]|uniref:Uncharacterized protein n=2 Tax=Rangifer tarandus platyrhynchus TaxID=3082113 RepID=A0ABN8Y7J8_RANTA|nr:unnamed protein product [Rangifer tarandus platyrhynchus]
MSLLFNMLSRLVITFLPRSKCLLISWLKSPSAVILEPPKIKSDTVSTVSPCISHEVTDYGKKKKMSITFYKYSSNNDYFRHYISCCVNKEKAYCFQMSQFGERE